ncbi:MAG: exonuclease SbcCD subunit [Phycisphaerales bacterium]|nr:exonuclease SbcCD subunit [Phycisphaerales bacterium]
MRFIHTADWHLGRLFHGGHLTDDQAHVLDQLVDLCRDAKPDALLVAGDVYDRAVPPPEAVGLLDDVLSRLVLDLEIPVVMIAGNHDSPGRLHFGARLLAGRRLYVSGQFVSQCEPIVFHDAHGPVHVYALPYAEPSTVRCSLASDAVVDHDSAMRAIVSGIRAVHPAGVRSILVAHAFVAGGQGCESERPLSVGGAGTVDVSCFAGFDYVALGHLHRPQIISANGTGAVRYSGSLLKYSFDESDQTKSVTVVEMDAGGVCRCEAVGFSPRREVRRISGLMADLLKPPVEMDGKDDYLEVTLLDQGPVLDAVGRLREVYPNVLLLERVKQKLDESAEAARLDHRKVTDLELFRAFYRYVTAKELLSPQEMAFAGVVEEMRRKERSA